MTDDSNGCGDWIPFKDEKCFKVFDKISPNSEAQNICRQFDSKLAIIRTEEEQHLIQEYLKSMKIVDNVWIGMTRNNHSFEWNDGTEMQYTDWLSGRPVYKADIDCAVISLDFVRQSANDWENYGKWLDVSCLKNSLALCEKVQPWSMIKLQNELMEIRKNYSEELEFLNTQVIPDLIKTNMKQTNLINLMNQELDTLKLVIIPEQTNLINLLYEELDELKNITIPEQKELIESQNNEINILKSNPVPIGFVYVELHGQPRPDALWPNTEWGNISANYSGLFFRAEASSLQHSW